MKFRDLPNGAHFKFADQPWGGAVKKVSDRCYVRAIKDVVVRKRPGKSVRAVVQPVCFTSLPRQDVIPTGRRSPVRNRRGRERGPTVLGRYRRSKKKGR